MKNYFLKGMTGLTMLALFAMVTMVSCKKDPDPDPILVEDGLYIKGAGTALTELISDGLLTKAKNEVLQETRNTMYEMYIAVKAGTEGFNLVNVVGGVEEVWGPGTDFAEVATEDLDVEEPNKGLWRGSYAISETAFTVPTDGLYHVVLDTEVGIIAIAKVEWGVIGAASPGGWSGSTQLDAPAFNDSIMAFSLTEVEMKKGDFKFRYSNGWKIILDTIVDLGVEGKKGVKANTNFGGAVDALVAGGDNINNTVTGFFTVTMTWELGEGTSVTLDKTGDLPSTDYSAYNMGLVGDGVYTEGAPVTWDVTFDKKTPAVDGTEYTWSWSNIDVRNTGSFKIRQNDNWDGLILGYPQVTMAGSGAANFGTNGDGNFVPVADGIYNFVLTVDGTVDDFTLTVEPVVL